ncbi:DUF4402 domain-containing protein [Halomonas sp. ML-15]|uniref:DUF4402 domain-containing protein n=1 Tax=Halomonas sp. ML-15 TaxID=2773305 RepID=UPI001745FBEE|nr:DUF4402 domain-containing protein [Halomonas sp. ML-15]MBD3896942.1 DUF4402 domain-containing protein [Halomonas sp. ML-15]
MATSTFMYKHARSAALVSAVALGSFGASSSFAAESSTTAEASVISPIAITTDVDLNFGRFAAGVAVGTVTVSTSGARTSSGDVILSTIGSSPAAAKFDVTGDDNATYTIAWSGATSLTNTAGAGETMVLARISDLTAGDATSGEVDTGTLSETGTQSIYLGGTLDVGAAQVAGLYTGDVTATVEYN